MYLRFLGYFFFGFGCGNSLSFIALPILCFFHMWTTFCRFIVPPHLIIWPCRCVYCVGVYFCVMYLPSGVFRVMKQHSFSLLSVLKIKSPMRFASSSGGSSVTDMYSLVCSLSCFPQK